MAVCKFWTSNTALRIGVCTLESPLISDRFMAAAKVLGEDAPAGGKAQQQTTMTQQRKNFENEE